MESAELLVYFLIAVIIGGLVLGTFKALDYLGYHKELKEKIKSREDVFNVDMAGFPRELAERWKRCGYGSQNATFSLYVNEEGMLNRSFVVDRLNMGNFCEDELIDCYGKKGRFKIFNETEIPALISIRCYNQTLIVEKVG
jgi:hypothetical protein